MTPLERIHALGMTARRFAEITKTHPVTVSYWGRQRIDKRTNRGGEVPVPGWVDALLAAYEECPRSIPKEKK